MIEAVNAAMLEMQGALLARSLYPEHHPRIRASEKRAGELLHDVLTWRQEITVFAVEDRVIVEEQVLPASGSLADSLFKRLRHSGVDRIVFRRGISDDEIRGFLDLLSEGEGQTPRASSHLSLGYIQHGTTEHELPSVLPEPGPINPLAGESSQALQGVWKDVGTSRAFDSGMLGDVISGISKALSSSSSAVLPLAELKRHDEYTFVHTINVALLSTALGEAVGLNGRDAHDLTLAALLHDVGKQAIPLDLLNKTGKFTDEEFRLVQLHPVEGARMLLATAGVPEIAPIVAFEHHVRADGSGYPKLPRRWRLSLASRVVQVADVFDALRTHRPYRPAMTLPEITKVMRKDVGMFFDEDLLEVFFHRVVSRGLPEPVPFES